jgi:hypothetical protein
MFIFNFNVIFICKIYHMYVSPGSLLRLPPPRRRVNQGKFSPAGRGRPEVAVWRIFSALLEQVIWGELRLRAS